MSFIKKEIKGRLAYITLCRADKKNAFNKEFILQLTDAISEYDANLAVKIIIINAVGDVFSAGADLEYLKALQQFSFEENLADAEVLKNLFLKIYTCKKVVIAQVEGHAIAGGCGLATICDFCFAIPEAKFGYTEVKIGFIPALVSVFLERKIQGSKVRELLLTGKLITADEAADINLIHEVVEKELIASYVKQFAEKICDECSSQSLASTKELLAGLCGLTLQDGLAFAANLNARSRASDDCKKGIATFLKREKITW